MPITDNRTTHLDLPLPDRQNLLEDDVERLKQAFIGVDNFAAAVDLVIAMLGTAANRDIGAGAAEVPDTERLNTRLGTTGNLGNAAQRTAQSSASDFTAGRLLAVGAGGITGPAINGFSNGVVQSNAENCQPGTITQFAGTETACVATNLPELGGGGNTERNWVVIASGEPTRLLLEATELLGLTGGSRGRKFIKIKEGTAWSAWIESFTKGNLPQISDVVGLTERLDEIETYALAGL